MDLAACRSAFLQNKIVMRFGCCLVAISMIMSCWTTPKAKAVVSETALLGSIFGSLLVSMGYFWAAENMDVPTFGEAIYDLIKQCDEEMDTGIQLLLDSHLAGLTAVGNGKLTFSQQWVKLANSFAEWFQGKYFVSGNSMATVLDGCISFTLTNDSGDTLSYPSGNLIYGKQHSPAVFDYVINEPCTVAFARSTNLFKYSDVDSNEYFIKSVTAYVGGKQLFTDSGEGDFNSYSTPKNDTITFTASQVAEGAILKFSAICGQEYPTVSKSYAIRSNIVVKTGSALTAEKPQEVHYPEVAEDGSQVYEITVDGVTATDIEGIIQGAVDQILAGTASIAGEVTQAQDVPADPEVPPELDGLDLPALGAALTSRFPFSIPWDVARGIGLLAAPAETPHFEVDFFEPISDLVGGWKGSTKIVLDFSEFEIIGRLCRWTSTIGFCLMLAAGTKRLIWVA